MQHQSSNDEITTITKHLLQALNGVVINRYERDNKGNKTLNGKIRVPIKYGYKTRQLEESISINGAVKLPIITVSPTGVNLDLNRNTSKQHDRNVKEWIGEDGIPRYYMPTPIKISYDVAFVTKLPSDFYQILQHYIAAFNPYIQVSWMHPYEKKKMISKITSAGNFAFDFPQNLPSDQKSVYRGSFSVEVEGWIFRDMKDSTGTINCITFNITTFNDKDDIFIEEESSDTFTINAAPSILEIEPECVEAGKYITLYGNNLAYVDAVFALPLSGGGNILTSSYEPFFLSENLSGDNTEFEGYMFEDYNVLDNNAIAVKIPEEWEAAHVDFLVTNRHSGYSILSESTSGDCHQPFLNIH